MKLKFVTGLLLTFLFINCQREKISESTTMKKDPHSYAIPEDAVVKHLHWTAKIDFQTRTIDAIATWDISVDDNADLITFDIKNLEIDSVWLDDKHPAEFRLSESDPLLGQALAILVVPGTKRVSIKYKTSPDAEALQWLDPQQTAGKAHPFLFTQSQAILARSWIPCQDSPDIRFTYEANVSGPPELLILMSASNPQQISQDGKYNFKMTQPIPSYLLALTAGHVAFKPISDRSGIYAEPSIVEKAAWEFADLEKMIAGSEELYGAYRWERYDVIVLPPSFPFGGMENPRLTFATPTILAGDRSLTSLIAHELAHSWSGNLVTNSSWNDFWLNEGFTVYFEHRIMEKLYGADYSEMLASLALQDLKETIEDLRKDNLYHDTKLQLSLENRNPDDGVTDIAYNKGYFFLRSIEEKHGRDKFDSFLKRYFSENAFKSMNTNAFIEYITSFYKNEFNITLDESEFQKWIYTEGLPPNCPQPKSDRFAKVQQVIDIWKTTGRLEANTKEWSTHEWLHFLKNLPPSTSDQMSQLDKFGSFTGSGNAEILTLWLVHAIKNNYAAADKKLEEFLITTGRRKFLSPLYNELVKSEKGRAKAELIYSKARPNYHFVATNTFDKLLQKQ